LNLKYTPEQEEELKQYEDIENYDEREDFILKFMHKHNKSKKSLVAKLSKMGIYKSKPKISKVTGDTPETKTQMVEKLGRKWGMNANELEGLDKAPKLTLMKILKRFEE
jgi:hypothetical protein